MAGLGVTIEVESTGLDPENTGGVEARSSDKGGVLGIVVNNSGSERITN
jgi:hypothetical protein